MKCTHATLLLVLAATVFLDSVSYAQGPVTIPRPANGKLRETTTEKRMSITVNVTDNNGKTIPSDRFPRSFEFGTDSEPTIQIPIPTQVNRSDNGEAETIVDVTKTTAVVKGTLPGEINDSSIEAIFFDTTTNQFVLGNIFGTLAARVGGEEILIPDLFADTSGDGQLGAGDLLYSLVDLNVYLNQVPTFSLGESFNIVNGQISGLPGMTFSATPFVFDANSGFSGAPFTGVGVVEAEAGIAAVPEPATWMMMLLGLGAVGMIIRRSHREVAASGSPTSKRRHGILSRKDPESLPAAERETNLHQQTLSLATAIGCARLASA